MDKPKIAFVLGKNQKEGIFAGEPNFSPTIPTSYSGAFSQMFGTDLYPITVDVEKLVGYDMVVIISWTILDRRGIIDEIHRKTNAKVVYIWEMGLDKIEEYQYAVETLDEFSKADGWITWGDYAEGVVRALFNKPTLCLNSPTTIDNVSHLAIPPATKEMDPYVFVLAKYNAALSVKVAEKILVDNLLDDWKIKVHIPSPLEPDPEHIKKQVLWASDRAEVSIDGLLWYPDFLSLVAGAYLVVNTDQRFQDGRLSADCAIVRTPCIAPRCWTRQRICWPDLAVESGHSLYEIRQAARKVVYATHQEYEKMCLNAFYAVKSASGMEKKKREKEGSMLSFWMELNNV